MWNWTSLESHSSPVRAPQEVAHLCGKNLKIGGIIIKLTPHDAEMSVTGPASVWISHQRGLPKSSDFKNQASHLWCHSDLQPGAAPLIMNGRLTLCISLNVRLRRCPGYWNWLPLPSFLSISPCSCTLDWHQRWGKLFALVSSFGSEWWRFTNIAQTVKWHRYDFF